MNLIIILFAVVLSTLGETEWKTVSIDNNLVVPLPVNYTRIDTMNSVNFYGTTESSTVVIAIQKRTDPGVPKTSSEMISDYEDLFEGFLETFNNSKVLSKQALKIGGIQNFKVVFSYDNGNAIIYSSSAFLMSDESIYCLQVFSLSMDGCRADFNRLSQGAAFKEK